MLGSDNVYEHNGKKLYTDEEREAALRCQWMKECNISEQDN